MHCPRCQGLLVLEWCFDIKEFHSIELLRCVPCGWRNDDVMTLNKQKPPKQEKKRKGRAPRQPNGLHTYRGDLCRIGTAG